MNDKDKSEKKGQPKNDDSNSGVTGWLNKQSTGKILLYIGIIFSVLLIVIFVGLILSWENTARINTYPGPGATGMQIEVNYPGTWEGNVVYSGPNSSDNIIQRVNGTGPNDQPNG